MSPGASILRKSLFCILPVGPLVSAPQHSTQSLSCFAVTPWVSVPSSVPSHGAAQRGLGHHGKKRARSSSSSRATSATACSCSLPWPQSPGCAGEVLRAPQQPEQPWAVLLATAMAVWGSKGLPCTAGSTGATEEQGCWVWGRGPAHASVAEVISAHCLHQ